MNKIALALLAIVLAAPVSAQDDEQEDEVASLDEIKAGLEIGWAALQDCKASDMDCSNLEDAIGQLGLAAKFYVQRGCAGEMGGIGRSVTENAMNYQACVRGRMYTLGLPSRALESLMQDRLDWINSAEGTVIVEEVDEEEVQDC
ncbi:MAG: hypothetical protein OXI17_03055 [Gammaproteobacteria bacterium]|nr:hypothetical protein [Gammaproteobacteria bacterium]